MHLFPLPAYFSSQGSLTRRVRIKGAGINARRSGGSAFQREASRAVAATGISSFSASASACGRLPRMVSGAVSDPKLVLLTTPSGR